MDRPRRRTLCLGSLWIRPVFDDRQRRLLMRVAIYAGVPAANTAFAHARRIIGA